MDYYSFYLLSNFWCNNISIIMKKDLRFLLCEPFGGLKKDTVDELENVVKDFILSFLTFLRENYSMENEGFYYDARGNEYTDEELYNIFIESYGR